MSVVFYRSPNNYLLAAVSRTTHPTLSAAFDAVCGVIGQERAEDTFDGYVSGRDDAPNWVLLFRDQGDMWWRTHSELWQEIANPQEATQ